MALHNDGAAAQWNGYGGYCRSANAMQFRGEGPKLNSKAALPPPLGPPAGSELQKKGSATDGGGVQFPLSFVLPRLPFKNASLTSLL